MPSDKSQVKHGPKAPRDHVLTRADHEEIDRMRHVDEPVHIEATPPES